MKMFIVDHVFGWCVSILYRVGVFVCLLFMGKEYNFI